MPARPTSKRLKNPIFQLCSYAAMPCPFKLSLHPSGGANAPTGLHQTLLPCIAARQSLDKNYPKKCSKFAFFQDRKITWKNISYGKHFTLLRIEKSLSTYKATANWNLQGAHHLHKRLRHTKDSHVEILSILCVLIKLYSYTSYQQHLKNALV